MNRDKEDETGKNKKPLQSDGCGAFGILGLNKTLCFVLNRKLKYKQPSAIQRKTIPAILKGRDVVCIARTGSGKTVAYLAPIVQILDCHSKTVGTRCLVLVPTRELALQISSVLNKFINWSNRSDCLRSATLIGGQSLEGQFGSLTFNPDIVVATPGRLSQHLVEKSFDMGLLSHFILDEADNLLEMGFLPDVYKIFSLIPENRQNILVSATLPSELAEFVNFGLSDPVIAQVERDMQINEQLELRFIYTRTEDKIPTLLKILRFHKDEERTIIFVATKHHVEFFRLFLSENGILASAIYGSMDMATRLQQMSLFRHLKTKILVVTDLAARGLDLPLVDNVINFDFPHSSKLFIHRVGRTARAGRCGLAISLLTLNDFSFFFEVVSSIGRRIIISEDRLIGNDVCCIGTVGDLATYAERTNTLLEDNSELKSLKMSMDASYTLYYKTRPSASKISVDKSQDLLVSLGGINAITSAVHPSYDTNLSTEENVVENGIGYLKNAKDSILEYLHKFRPSSCKTTIVTTVSAGSIAIMERAKRFARSFGFHVSNAESAEKSRKVEDFLKKTEYLVPSSSPMDNKEELRLSDVTLNITPDTESLLQKDRFKRKSRWNPQRKRFMDVTVDSLTNRIVKNESGKKVRNIVENKDQLKNWTKKTRQRIQKLGELEEPQKPKMSKISEEIEHDYDDLIKMFPKHAAVFEAASLNRPMTNKQKRTLKRLTSKPNPEQENNTESKKGKRKKVKRLSASEIRKKRFKKISARGAPSRSKIIIRKKRHQ